MAAIGLTCNDWLPTGLLHDIGAVGNTDRRDLLRGLSIALSLGAISLLLARDWVARNLGALLVMSISTAVSLLLFVGVDVSLSRRAVNATVGSDAIHGVHMSDPLLGWRPQPGAVGQHAEDGSFAVEYRIDENGYKSIPNAGTPRRRIFIFGDSYTFGHGVANADTYANILANKYLDKAVHVYNVGVLGYGIEQMYGRFLEIEPHLRARDLVIFAPTSQDLKRNLKDFVFPSKLIFGRRLGFGDRYPYYDGETLTSVELATPWNSLKAMLFNGRWTKKIFRFLHSAVTSPPTTAEAVAMIEAVRTMTTSRGAGFALYFLPQTKECRLGAYEEDVSLFEFYDLMRFFPGDEASLAALRFATNTHWNPAGHELVAAAVVETLLEQGHLGTADLAGGVGLSD